MKEAPLVFWYAVSSSLAVLAIGLSFSVVRSSTLSLEIADSKLSLSNKIAKTQQLTQKLEGTVDKIEASNCRPVPEIREIKQELSETSEDLEDIQDRTE